MVKSMRRREAVAAAMALLIAVTSPEGVTSFQLRSIPAAGGLSRSSNALRTFALHSENPNKESDFPKEEEVVGEAVGEQYEGSVDWDAEWKKVVENRDQPSQRPGKYKTPAEIAAIKTTNRVAKNVFDAKTEMQSKLPSPPSIRSLQGADWRFWIGMIAIVSFGLSILSATSSTPVNESFYI